MYCLQLNKRKYKDKYKEYKLLNITKFFTGDLSLRFKHSIEI